MRVNHEETELKDFAALDRCPKCGRRDSFSMRYYEAYNETDDCDQSLETKYVYAAHLQHRTQALSIRGLPADVTGIILHECMCGYFTATRTFDDSSGRIATIEQGRKIAQDFINSLKAPKLVPPDVARHIEEQRAWADQPATADDKGLAIRWLKLARVLRANSAAYSRLRSSIADHINADYYADTTLEDLLDRVTLQTGDNQERR